ncbi:MAG TPA: TraR/DksA C4-type zinc finger protein [Planctomycetota bacterium]|nr:TraR/DksA C4-type zinc finger protein [Planctomycetota bacterium]
MSSKPKSKKSKPAAKPAAASAKPAAEATASLPVKGGLTKSELNEFKGLLLTRKKVLQGDVKTLEDEACKKGSDAAGDLSTLPMHMADLGTDSHEQDISLGLMENESDEIHEIQDAFDRIKDGSFGLCENCRKKIPKERLRAIPYTRFCVPCKKKEEGV